MQVVIPGDNTNLKLTLFQYPTCPFCCKVRAFLDYYGFSYKVVEVNPVLRQQIKWTDYKKVPIVLANIEDGYQVINITPRERNPEVRGLNPGSGSSFSLEIL